MVTGTMGKPIRFRAFLSCSIRPQDRYWVDFVREKVLRPNGIGCCTVGVDVSAPQPPLDTMREWIEKSDCVVAIATARFEARDIQCPQDKLLLLPYAVDEELLMGWLSGKPLVVFKAEGLSATGILGAQKTTWIQFDPSDSLSLRRQSTHPLIISMLRNLLRELKQRKRMEITRRVLDWGAKGLALLGAYGLGRIAARADTDEVPDCFGEHDGRFKACRECPWRKECQEEKYEVEFEE